MNSASGSETPSMRTTAKIAQACVRCHQKKSKCDGNVPSCSNCDARGEECVYRASQRKRGPGRSKQHIRDLEKRLSDLETRLRRSSPPLQNVDNSGALSTRNEAPAVEVAPYSSEPALPDEEEPPGAESASRNLRTPRVPVEELDTTEEAYERLPLFKMVTNNLTKDYTSPAVAESLKRVPGVHIPVRQSEANLVENTIQQICGEFPIFDIPSFLDWIREPSNLKQRDKPPQWACLNATVALSLLMKTLNRSYTKVAQIAWAYLKNAHEALPEVMIQGSDIWKVRAALVMATFMLKGSGDTRAAAMLLSIAVRMMQTNNLQLVVSDPESDASRLFWTAYVLDTEISLNCGVPPLLHDEDIDAPLPLLGVQHNDLPSSSLGRTVFAVRANLSTIQARVRKQLYAVQASRLSDDEVIQNVAQLASALDVWRANVPTDIQPGRHGKVSDSVLQTPVIMLHLSYYNTVSMLHWAVRRHSRWATGSATGLHQEQMEASAIRVKTATMVVVQLGSRIRSKSLTDVWRMIPYMVAPGISFLALILENPNLVRARLNIRMLELLVELVETLVNDEHLDFQSVLKGCTAMRELATEAINGDPSLNIAATYHQVHMTLGRMTHPMLVAQALLGSIPNRDTAVARSFSAALSMPYTSEDGFSPWVPMALRPETYGFKYDLA